MQRTIELRRFGMSVEEVAEIGARHSARLLAECGQDRVGDRITECIAEDELGGLLGVAPALEGGLKVGGTDGRGSIEDGVNQCEADNVCLGTGGDGTEQTGPAIRQPRVGGRPHFLGFRVETDCGVSAAADDLDDLADTTGQVVPHDRLAPKRQQARTLDAHKEQPVGKPVGIFGFIELPAQFLCGDVSDQEMWAPVARSGEFLLRF